MADALRMAVGFVTRDVLAGDDPPRFTHPIVRDAVEASLDTAERDAAHRRAARVLYDDDVPSGQVAAHLIGLRPAGDAWVLGRLREAAHEAMQAARPVPLPGSCAARWPSRRPPPSAWPFCARPRARR
jgi:hypothetical protein